MKLYGRQTRFIQPAASPFNCSAEPERAESILNVLRVIFKSLSPRSNGGATNGEGFGLATPKPFFFFEKAKAARLARAAF